MDRRSFAGSSLPPPQEGIDIAVRGVAGGLRSSQSPVTGRNAAVDEFRCDVCDTVWGTKRGLSNHQRCHGMYYKCTECPTRTSQFKTKKMLAEHFGEVHGGILKKNIMQHVQVCFKDQEVRPNETRVPEAVADPSNPLPPLTTKKTLPSSSNSVQQQPMMMQDPVTKRSDSFVSAMIDSGCPRPESAPATAKSIGPVSVVAPATTSDSGCPRPKLVSAPKATKSVGPETVGTPAPSTSGSVFPRHKLVPGTKGITLVTVNAAPSTSGSVFPQPRLVPAPVPVVTSAPCTSEMPRATQAMASNDATNQRTDINSRFDKLEQLLQPVPLAVTAELCRLRMQDKEHERNRIMLQKEITSLKFTLQEANEGDVAQRLLQNEGVISELRLKLDKSKQLMSTFLFKRRDEMKQHAELIKTLELEWKKKVVLIQDYELHLHNAYETIMTLRSDQLRARFLQSDLNRAQNRCKRKDDEISRLDGLLQTKKIKLGDEGGTVGIKDEPETEGWATVGIKTEPFEPDGQDAMDFETGPWDGDSDDGDLIINTDSECDYDYIDSP